MTYGQLERRNGEQDVGREPRVDLAGQHITQAVSELETHTPHTATVGGSPAEDSRGHVEARPDLALRLVVAVLRQVVRQLQPRHVCAYEGHGQFMDRSVGRRWAQSSGRGGGPGAAEDRSRRPRYDSRAATSEETNAAELPNPVFLGSAQWGQGLVRTGKRTHDTRHTTHSQMPT